MISYVVKKSMSRLLYINLLVFNNSHKLVDLTCHERATKT